MPNPVLLVVEQDADALRDVERELHDRYATHYRVMGMKSAGEALRRMEDLAAAGEQVALLLAGESVCAKAEFLAQARHLHPHAKRGLVIAWGRWGDRTVAETIFDAIARGWIDHYVLRPSEPPDELFHQAVSSLLLDWTESQRASPYTISVVGDSWSGRAYELRELLGRCAIPHAFCLADSDDGRALIEGAGESKRLPMVFLPDGRVLVDPSNAEMAKAAGSPIHPERMEFDLVIVGAGPAGLSAAVYGASEGLATLVVDEGGLGGQATSSPLIRNYLGFPRGVSGRRLARQAYEQAWVFGAQFSFMQRATDVRREESGGLSVALADSGRVHTRAVLLAMGATYRRIGIPSLEALNGAGVFYGGAASEAPAMAGKQVYVLGGANSAGQAALHLARYARRVTLVIRAESLEAGMSHYLSRQVEATPNLEVRLGTEIVGGGGDGWVEQLVLRDRDGGEGAVDADALFVMIGARPHTDWLPPEIRRDPEGFVVTGADLETSMPGVFAAGDVRHGSVKRVASAVGEGSAAIQQLHRFFESGGLVVGDAIHAST